MNTLLILTLLTTLIGSILPEVLIHSSYVLAGKLVLLSLITLVTLLKKKWRVLWRYPVVMMIILLSFALTAYIRGTSWWNPLFQGTDFFSQIAGNIAVKPIGVLPVAAALLLLCGPLSCAYLSIGSLNRKADAIPWLGIRAARISWLKLSLISGVLIMVGTVILSFVTTPGLKFQLHVNRLLTGLPLILLLALVNSFCENLVFRCAIMAPLRCVMPKLFVLLTSALFFGIAHYEGVPGGILGAIMSGVMGYFISLSIYETDGFASGWIIHFFQDVAIFSTLALMV